MPIPSHLSSTCGARCVAVACTEAVKERPETGRWFITIGHPGFNSPANNRDGYASRASAVAAFRKYGGR